MSLAFILSVVGLSLNAVASIVLVFTLLPSNEVIEKMSGTYFGQNPHLKKGLERSKGIAKIGLILLLIGFLCQLASQIISI